MSCRVTAAVAGGGAALRPGPGRGGRGERPRPPRRHRPGRHHDHDAQGDQAAAAARSPRPRGRRGLRLLPGLPAARNRLAHHRITAHAQPTGIPWTRLAAGAGIADRGRTAAKRLAAADADCTEIEDWAPLGIDGGVGPVRHPVGAHALAEFQHADQQQLHLGRRETGRRCRPGAGAGRPFCGRLELGTADPELLRARELAIAAPAAGSGKFGTPCERMQREKASLLGVR